MALYFLSYDLRKQRNYQPLYDELERFKAERSLESVWVFRRMNTTAVDLRNHFQTFIDSDDGLLVIEADQWASRWLLNDPNKVTY